MTRRIAARKGGRTARAPEARIRPQTLQRIHAEMRERDKSFADLLEESYGGNEMLSVKIEYVDGKTETVEVDAPNQRDAMKIARQHAEREEIYGGRGVEVASVCVVNRKSNPEYRPDQHKHDLKNRW